MAMARTTKKVMPMYSGCSTRRIASVRVCKCGADLKWWGKNLERTKSAYGDKHLSYRKLSDLLKRLPTKRVSLSYFRIIIMFFIRLGMQKLPL